MKKLLFTLILSASAIFLLAGCHVHREGMGSTRTYHHHEHIKTYDNMQHRWH
jgi:hypothetical protein